jgi:IclR family transcriptional regulator, KDG regulon repressor
MMSTIRKGIDVLEAFTLNDRERSITELSRELNIPQPTIHHILKSMKQRGWVAQNPETRRYRLGIRLWELGCVAVNYRELSEVLRPHLRRLVDKLNETAVVAMIAPEDPTNVVYRERADSSQPVRAVAAIGSRLPSHCTAMGKAIIAHNDDLLESLLQHELRSYTDASITDAELLRADLARTRERGYSISKGEIRSDMTAVATPIHDHVGVVRMSVGMWAPTYRMTDEFIHKVAPIIAQSGNDMSTDLGFNGEVEKSRRTARPRATVRS